MIVKTGYEYFEVRESGALSIVRLLPAVTVAATSTDDVQSELMDFVARRQCFKLVLDLSAVKYLPSAMIGVIVVLSSRGTEVHLANASDDIVQVMQIMGLTERIRVNEHAVAPAGTPRPTADVAAVTGFLISCPHCDCGNAVDSHSLGQHISCLNCHQQFRAESDLFSKATHVRCHCPACEQSLSLESDWLGSQIRCSFCDYGFKLRRIR